MELYILDSRLRRTGVVLDRFESLIWTERFSAWGDFEINLFSTPETRRLLPAGTRLALSESYRVMVVEFIEDAKNDDGKEMLKVTGRSLEAIMEDRSARNTFANLTVAPKWTLTGTPGNIARQIFNEICRTNVNFEDDEIPFLQVGSLFSPGTIAEPTDVITVELGLGTVYKAVKEICEAYSLGFRLVRNYDRSELYFDIYSGNNRTTQQSTLAPVVFSPNLDNLANVSELNSISGYKNVAYVFHPETTQIVTAAGVSVEISGFERRVLTVDASDIDIPERPYTVSAAQTKSLKAAIQLSTIPVDDTTLQKVLDKLRLTSDEVVIVQKYGTGGSSTLPAADKLLVTEALNVNTAYAPTEMDNLNKALQQKGKEELSKAKALTAFDGELPLNSPYPYEIAYQLGDIVEMRNVDGATNQMRVMEQIFVSDATGERSYPSLVLDQFIIPGTWLSWDFNQVWETVDGTWGDLGGGSGEVSLAVPVAPNTPTAVSETTSSVVSWTDTGNSGMIVYDYEFEYADNTLFAGAEKAVTAAKTLTITNQIPATAYSYRVRARNSLGLGAWSPTKTQSTKTGIMVGSTGAAGTKLTIPTHVSPAGGQTKAPSVVDMGTAWNGYRYWMAHSPYPGSDDSHSDPNIVASTNGTTWVIPSGLTNPLDNQPGSPGAYNSDVDLVYGPDGYMWLFWRTYTATATGTEEKLYLRRSNNGTSWTAKVLIWQTAASAMRLISPSFLFENGAWTMYGIDALTFKTYKVRSTGPTLTAPSSWGTPVEVHIPSTGVGRQPWQIEIRKIDGVYVGLLNDRPTGVAPGGNLFVIRSLDGVEWTVGPSPAIPRSGGSAPGHKNLYRATFTKKTDLSLDVWYTGWNDTPLPTIWNVFRTTIAS